MGKTSETLRKLANLSPEITTDGKVLWCDLCDAVINHSRKSNVTQHLETAKHTGLAARKKEKLQHFVSQIGESVQDQFVIDLVKTFVECDIPLHTLRNPKMKAFLEKYTGLVIPSEATLRSQFPGLFPDPQMDETTTYSSSDES